MKTALILCSLVALCSAAAIEYSDYHGNGQPACEEVEWAQRDWRNTWDPSSFWRCVEEGQPGVAVSCHEATGEWGFLFSEAAGQCVPAADWVWTFPQAPPSQRA